MDEEDHEALINLFKTIGEKIDNRKAQPHMKVYFNNIKKLSDDTTLSSRLRFAYGDLIDMRANGWKLRREVETAKSLDEIRKDAEREERMAQMQSQQGGGGDRGNPRYDSRGPDGGRGGRWSSDVGRGGRGVNDRDSGYRGRDGGRGGRGDRENTRGYDSRGSDRNTGVDNRGSDGGRGGGGYGSRDGGSREGGFTSSRAAPPSISLSRPPPLLGGQGILPPRTGGGRGNDAVTPDMLNIRAKSIRQEWLQDPNKEELLMSVEEVIASPDAGKTIVQNNIDYAAVDGKASEIKRIIDMIVVLYENKKVTDSDIKAAVGNVVEFIDSYACDNPRIYDDVGDMFSAFTNALTVQWLCECTGRLSDERDKFKVIEAALKSVHKSFGDSAVRSFLESRIALEKLLGATKLRELEEKFG